MAIPKFTRRHVLAASHRIDREGVPPRRKSTSYVVLVRGRPYPPKYVVSVAIAESTGHELPPYEFYGGKETNVRLRALGFEVLEVAGGSRAD